MNDIQAQEALKRGLINQTTFDKIKAMSPAQVEQMRSERKDELERQDATPSGIITQPTVSQSVPELSSLGVEDLPVMEPPAIETATADQLEIAAPVAQPQQLPAADFSGLGTIQAGIQQSANAGVDAAKKEAAFVDGFQSELQKFDSVQNQKREAQQKSIDDKMRIVQDEVDKVGREEVKPDRIFSNMNVFQKIGLVLAAGIAKGYANIDVLDGLIERDISAQKQGIASRMDAARSKQSYYMQMRERLNDDRLAADATRGSMLEAAKLKLQSIAAMSRSEQVKASALQQIGELELKKQEVASSYAQRAQQLAQQQQIEQADPIAAKIMRFPEPQQKRLNEAREVFQTTEAAKKYIDEAYSTALRIGLKGAIPFTEEKAMIDTYNAGIESAIRATMKGQGTIQESEIDRLVKPFLIATSDRELVQKTKRDQLKRVLESKNEGQISVLRSFGLIPKQASSLKKNE